MLTLIGQKNHLTEAAKKRKNEKEKDIYTSIYFFFFEKWILADKINMKVGNHPIQKIIYMVEHTPARFEEKKIVLLAGLRHVRLHYLAD